MYSEAFLLTAGIKELLKDLVPRWRPYTYDGIGGEDYPSAPENDDDYYNSFPSGHTAYAFMGAAFLTTTLLQDYPGKKWTVPVAAAAITTAAAVGIMRIASGEHFISDTLAGALIGGLTGWLIPFIHDQFTRRMFSTTD